MFEYIVAMFKVVVGIFTPERIVLTACVALGVLILWILFSLLFSFQSRFSRNCRKLSMLIDTHGLTAESYPKFIELAASLPDSFLRGWKTFEHANKGLPSEYLKRSECLDAELTGGLFNQNRSTMRTYITLFTVMFSLIGVAAIGKDVAITAYALAEALVVPFLFAAIGMLVYYLYTALRHYQYRICVEDFNEMLDILNEKVECSEIEFSNGNYESSEFIKNIVDPKSGDDEKIVFVNDNESEQREFFDDVSVDSNVQNEEVQENAEVLIGDHQVEFEAPQEEIVEEPTKTEESVAPVEEAKNNVQEDISKGDEIMENPVEQEKKRGRGRPKKEKAPEGELIIKSDEEFEEVLARAEKLMKKNEEPLSVSQQKRVEKALKELVDAMKKYKGEM